MIQDMADENASTEDVVTDDPTVEQESTDEQVDETPDADPAVDEPAGDSDEEQAEVVQDDATELPTDEPKAESAEGVVVEPGQSPDPDVGKFDIRTGDVWSANTDGESLNVVGITADGDPIVADSTGEHVMAAETLVQGFRHDGPNHHEAGVARL